MKKVRKNGLFLLKTIDFITVTLYYNRCREEVITLRRKRLRGKPKPKHQKSPKVGCLDIINLAVAITALIVAILEWLGIKP